MANDYNGLVNPILYFLNDGEGLTPQPVVMPAYGPWDSLESAKNGLIEAFGSIEDVPRAYTFCVISDNKPEEWWFTRKGDWFSVEPKCKASSSSLVYYTVTFGNIYPSGAVATMTYNGIPQTVRPGGSYSVPNGSRILVTVTCDNYEPYEHTYQVYDNITIPTIQLNPSSQLYTLTIGSVTPAGLSDVVLKATYLTTINRTVYTSDTIQVPYNTPVRITGTATGYVFDWYGMVTENMVLPIDMVESSGEPTTYNLTVNVTPSEASDAVLTITYGSTTLQAAPGTPVPIPNGSYCTITGIKQGYTASPIYTAINGQDVTMTLAFAEDTPVPEYGELEIREVNPEDARIEVDGRTVSVGFVGRYPQGTNVRVVISKTGYITYDHTYSIEGGGVNPVIVRLQEENPELYTLIVNAIDSSNNQPVNTASISVMYSGLSAPVVIQSGGHVDDIPNGAGVFISVDAQGYYNKTDNFIMSGPTTRNISLVANANPSYDLTINVTPSFGNIVHHSYIDEHGQRRETDSQNVSTELINNIMGGTNAVITVSGEGYETQTRTVMMNGDKTESFELIKKKYTLKVTTIPSDATITVSYEGVSPITISSGDTVNNIPHGTVVSVVTSKENYATETHRYTMTSNMDETISLSPLAGLVIYVDTPSAQNATIIVTESQYEGETLVYHETYTPAHGEYIYPVAGHTISIEVYKRGYDYSYTHPYQESFVMPSAGVVKHITLTPDLTKNYEFSASLIKVIFTNQGQYSTYPIDFTHGETVTYRYTVNGGAEQVAVDTLLIENLHAGDVIDGYAQLTSVDGYSYHWGMFGTGAYGIEDQETNYNPDPNTEVQIRFWPTSIFGVILKDCDIDTTVNRTVRIDALKADSGSPLTVGGYLNRPTNINFGTKEGMPVLFFYRGDSVKITAKATVNNQVVQFNTTLTNTSDSCDSGIIVDFANQTITTEHISILWATSKLAYGPLDISYEPNDDSGDTVNIDMFNGAGNYGIIVPEHVDVDIVAKFDYDGGTHEYTKQNTVTIQDVFGSNFVEVRESNVKSEIVSLTAFEGM